MTRRRLGSPGAGRGLAILLLGPLLGVLAAPEAAESTSLFDKLDAIKITVEIGGPLDLEGGTSPRLFGQEVGRSSRFRTSLSRSLGSTLEACGILWDEGAPNGEVSISVFGRLDQGPEGPPLYVYLVKGEVLNSKLETDRSGPEPFPLRSVIGVASDGGLESAIIDAAVAIVSDELGSCES